MEGFLLSAAGGALKPVIVKLSTLLGEEYKNMKKDVRKEIKPLCDELDHIHAFLLKMSEEENPDVQDKVWMTDVREMSYDIEDSLDEFMLRVDDDGGRSANKPQGLIDKCKKLLTKTKAHGRICKEIQDFKTQIKMVGDRNPRYRTGARMSTTKAADVMVDCRALAIFNEASELVGVDGPKNELISLLTTRDDGGRSSWCQPHLKVVSIVGSGGLGKTTLANQVYESLKDKFDCGAFVTVSRNPDMMKVLRSILSEVSGLKYRHTEAGDVQHLIKNISNFLRDKRYFIVVDDVWDLKSWEIIKCAFVKNNCGSRIITTTRINEVAESCSSPQGNHIYEIRPLNMVNSRRLFQKRIFGSEEECPAHLSKVSDEILKKCDGLPLAIIAIAGLLATKAQTLNEWNKVQRSFGYALERDSGVSAMIQILSLSYFDLPSHLRSCLLYLSIFPEDYEIQKERLVLRWIAEGFIHEEHGYTLYELGERCFNELINRSLIQPESSDLLGPLTSCRVHDTILEFAVSKAVEENFVTVFGVPNATVDPRRKIRRLSLQDRNEIPDASSGLPENLIYSHARAVSVFAGSLVNLPSLLVFRHVRVMDLEDSEGLEAHHLAQLCRLFALRYLSLRGTGIHELPHDIGDLQYLETLDVRGNGIKKLPPSIVRLVRLVNLLCDFDVKLPDGFGAMQALQKMKHVDLLSQSPSFAQELRQLTNLRMLQVQLGNYCGTTFQEGSMKHGCEFTKDLASSLRELGARSLSTLIITAKEAYMDLVMEPWSPAPRSLRQLQIRGICVPRVPRWIGSLDNLQELFLVVERLGAADVGFLGRIPALSCLYLFVEVEVADDGPSSSSRRVKVSGAHGFPCLRMFRVGSCDCGFGLLFEAGAMPKLRDLNLEFDGAKTEALTDGEFDFGIHHLACLARITCDLGMMVPDPSYEPEHPAWFALKTAVSSHPNHPRLYHAS